MAWYLWVLLIYLLIGAAFDFYGVRVSKEPVNAGVLALVFVGWLPMIIGMLIMNTLRQDTTR
jgi:hypothetical protein